MAKKRTAATSSESDPAESKSPLAGTAGYTVLARRYRPQQFHELIGQQHVAQSLVNAIKANRVAHAYLFTGARGVGKTSAARILAKALNCVEGPTPTPCDRCESCMAVALGEDVDVIEIDGASNNKVEEVRELRQNVQFRPSRSRYKIYIIDEVHMLTAAAFNALLKTLEEPPPHVKFIFATTEVDKVLITIRSRCQRFDFAGIGSKEIAARLGEIVAAEGFEAEEEALQLIARRAGGSLRDAESLLDQLLAFGEQRLTAAAVHQLLGTADADRVVELAQTVLRHDIPAAMEQLNAACDAGVQLGELVDQLMDFWRDLLLWKTAGPTFDGFLYAAKHREVMHEAAGKLQLDTILAGLDLLAATRTRFRFASQPRILVEMLLVRLARLEELISVAALAELWSSGAAAAPRPAQRAPAGEPQPSVQTAETISTSLYKKGYGQNNPSSKPQIAFTEASLGSIWETLLARLGKLAANDLGRSRQAILAPNTLVIRFSAQYNKEYERCAHPSAQAKLEAVLRELTGQPVAIRFELQEAEGGHAIAATRGGPAPRRSDLRREAAQVPLVQSAVRHLGAQLLHAEEGFGATPVVSGPTQAEESQDDV